MAIVACRIFRKGIFKKCVTLLCSNTESVVPQNYYGVRLLKTEVADDSLIEQASAALIDDEDEVKAKEEELERKRNKSRLKPHHRNLLHGSIPYSEPMEWFHETVKYKRKMYGRYGQASGVIPGVMWPTKEDLEEIKEYERVAYPDTIEEMVRKMELKKTNDKEAIKEREEQLLKKYAKLEQWKNEVRNNAAKKLAAAEASKAKKERLVEEVRRHFGFKIDPRDDRFKEMLEQKEKEERKLAKEAKKKARYQLALSRLQTSAQMKVEGTENVNLVNQSESETDEIESPNTAQKT